MGEQGANGQVAVLDGQIEDSLPLNPPRAFLDHFLEVSPTSIPSRPDSPPWPRSLSVSLWVRSGCVPHSKPALKPARASSRATSEPFAAFRAHFRTYRKGRGGAGEPGSLCQHDLPAQPARQYPQATLDTSSPTLVAPTTPQPPPFVALPHHLRYMPVLAHGHASVLACLSQVQYLFEVLLPEARLWRA